ncbi:hypothetical protein GCM10009765_33110 [Fodinicola feengrottensis]|uniref:Secreted protein n=1 Tax=Fodinicola feengrottensis TaxID=435914 RepID=A0ABN2H489_9ACTN
MKIRHFAAAVTVVGALLALAAPAAAASQQVVTKCDHSVCLDLTVNITGAEDNWTATAYIAKDALPYYGHFAISSTKGATIVGPAGEGPPPLTVRGVGVTTVCAKGWNEKTPVGEICQNT